MTGPLCLRTYIQISDLVALPMSPSELQGDTPETSRLQALFAPCVANGLFHRACAYTLRTLQCGGHWIALLPPSCLGMHASDASAAVLCDSLHRAPFLLSQPEAEDLLTACAIENIDSLENDALGRASRWGCFLVGDVGRRL